MRLCEAFVSGLVAAIGFGAVFAAAYCLWRAFH